jgi:hypothetical protein
MKDSYTNLEHELLGLSPAHPGKAFEERISDALGLQGELAVRNLNTEEKAIPFGVVRNWVIAASFALLLGVVGAAIYLQKYMSHTLANSPIAEVQPRKTTNVVSIPDSTPRIQDSVGTWLPQNREAILIEVRNEGIVREPTLPPTQQFRYRYYDTSTFTDSVNNSRMRVTVPREQVFQVKLEPY